MPARQPNREQDDQNPHVNDQQNLPNNPDNQQQENSPNVLRLTITFFLTFFTSLIPERPRVAN